MAGNTYMEMQVTQPGEMQFVERDVPTSVAGEVLIRVEACGICRADAGVIEGLEAGLMSPRVLGHEVVGRILAVGDGTSPRWQVGQRVGAGRLGGHCNECEQCRQGHFNLCLNQPVVGSSRDGGYAQMMLARATGLVQIPDALDAVQAAPLLCAGIATFNALRKSGALPVDLVAIQGIGGLGHLAIQYARRMGFKVVAVGRGGDIADQVLDLGAHHYVDGYAEDAVARLKAMGGAQVILTTITDSVAVSPLMAALAPQGTMLVVGVVRVLSNHSDFKGVQLTRTDGQHGSDATLTVRGKQLDKVSGVVLQRPGFKTIYVSGDTVWITGPVMLYNRQSPGYIVRPVSSRVRPTAAGAHWRRRYWPQPATWRRYKPFSGMSVSTTASHT